MTAIIRHSESRLLTPYNRDYENSMAGILITADYQYFNSITTHSQTNKRDFEEIYPLSSLPYSPNTGIYNIPVTYPLNLHILIGFRLSFGMPETNNTILYMSFYILTYSQI